MGYLGELVSDQPKFDLKFDLKAGVEAREDAIKRVEMNADWAWKSLMRLALIQTAHECDLFTCDDVWKRMSGDVTTHEKRAMGAIMRWGQKYGYCVPTENFRMSEQPQCHRRPMRVWRSTYIGETIPADIDLCHDCGDHP